jgi:hypothetical protein
MEAWESLRPLINEIAELMGRKGVPYETLAQLCREHGTKDPFRLSRGVLEEFVEQLKELEGPDQ